MDKKSIFYVAFLRGINVGGHSVKMEVLRKLFQEMGHGNVGSYIQTGNIFFTNHEKNRTILIEKIEAHLHQALGYSVPVCLRTLDEIEDILALDPFKEINVTQNDRLSVTFLQTKLEKALQLPQVTPDGGFELIGATESELFVVWHLINGRPGKSYVFEHILETSSTTRFWHTLIKILTAAKKHSLEPS